MAVSGAQPTIRKLYELCGAEDARKTSPFCWRIRFSLRHKGLAYESVPWRRVEKDSISFTGQGKVPVLVDGDTKLHDSWRIAQYLEAEHPQRPSLFQNHAAESMRFVILWVDQCLVTTMRNILALAAIEVSADRDKDFYRDKLQNVHSVNLQQAGPSASNFAELEKVLTPLRSTLKDQQYLCGQQPSYADFAAAGAFAWARSVSSVQLLDSSDPVYAWRARVFALFQQDLAETVGFQL